MEIAIQTALIAAGSAFLGALVPSVFSYLGKRQEYKNKKKVRLDERKINVYEQYLIAAQDIVQNKNEDKIKALQVATIKLRLYADDKDLVKYADEYFEHLTDSSLTTGKGHKYYQDHIISFIRKELGYYNRDAGYILYLTKEQAKKANLIK